MNRIDRIKQKLSVLKPHYIEIVDESPKHAGHLEDSTKEATHLSLFISATSLEDETRVKQHKIIKDLLIEEFDQGLHALSIKILKQEEK